MKKFAFFLVFLLGFFCGFPAFPLTTEISQDEVIDETARLTGLSKDILELLYEEVPSLFVNLKRTAFTVKMLHLFVSARDGEAIVELLSRSADASRSALLSGPFKTFINAAKAYKTSLEAIRDYVFIPALDESTYQNYRSSRLMTGNR
ncbi:MAG: hypothetical protein ABDK94_07495 [Atribacterota bacterium]